MLLGKHATMKCAEMALLNRTAPGFCPVCCKVFRFFPETRDEKPELPASNPGFRAVVALSSQTRLKGKVSFAFNSHIH